MVKLFDEDIKTTDRKSSKGNQLKFERDRFWYKADNLGYEGLAECVVSALLHKSSLDEKEFTDYEQESIEYNGNIYRGCKSPDFTDGWKLITLDAIFLNEDRHTHNMAVLMNDRKEFRLCPIFDNGGALLSDTKMDYPLERDVYEQIGQVRPKTFGETFEEQLEISEKLYGNNISFTYSEKDIDSAIKGLSDYSAQEKERVKEIILQTRRKYGYLFSK